MSPFVSTLFSVTGLIVLILVAAGWCAVEAIPAMAPDPRASNPWPGRVLPTAEGLECSRQVVHELIGIPYYWLRGWWQP